MNTLIISTAKYISYKKYTKLFKCAIQCISSSKKATKNKHLHIISISKLSY